MNATRKTVVGVDTAKSVFRLCTVEQVSGEVINKQLKRAQFWNGLVTVRPAWSGCRRAAARSTGHASSRSWGTN